MHNFYKFIKFNIENCTGKNLIILNSSVNCIELILNWIRKKTWKPKGKIYSLKCNQCKEGFISNQPMEAPICGSCLQKIKSIDLTVDLEKKCVICGRKGAIYSSNKCNDCYFK